MTLSTQGNAISGVGTWAGEACCSGPLSVTGTVENGLVTLDMAFTVDRGAQLPPFTQHFEGRALTFNSLEGTLTDRGQSIPYSYRRLQ